MIIVVVEVEIFMVVVVADVVVVPLDDVDQVEVRIGAEQAGLLLGRDAEEVRSRSHRPVPLSPVLGQVLKPRQSADGPRLYFTLCPQEIIKR